MVIEAVTFLALCVVVHHWAKRYWRWVQKLGANGNYTPDDSRQPDILDLLLLYPEGTHHLAEPYDHHDDFHDVYDGHDADD